MSTMLPSLQALQTVLEHAAVERDRAVSELFSALENGRRLRSQADQLLIYRDDYQQRWTTQFRHHAAIEVVTSYQQFVERLEQALEQLRLQVERAGHEETRARDQLTAREIRVASVRKLIERRMVEHAQRQTRRDQRQTDENAAHAARHTLAHAANP